MGTPAVPSLNVSGLLDGYFNSTPNDPASRTLLYRNFDVRTNGFGLNMGRLAIGRDAEPIGFRVDLGAGKAWDIFNFQDKASGFNGMKFVPQAFVSLQTGLLEGGASGLWQVLHQRGGGVDRNTLELELFPVLDLRQRVETQKAPAARPGLFVATDCFSLY
jgi:hypothetical protein